jgi:Flp pilus assembly protein protease CpaA
MINNYNLLNNQNLFLIILGLIWIIGAVMQDLKRREVDNVWNFSLIFFALAYRAGFSIYNNDYWYFLNGLLGFAIFLLLGNLFYYLRVFAGGDAKLMISFGAILPFSFNWISNFKIFGLFIFLFLISGSFYVFIWSIVLMIKHWNKFKKQYLKQTKNYKKMFYFSFLFFIFGIIFEIIFQNIIFIILGLIAILFPVMFVFAKSIEESCMIRALNPDKVREGDWLYKDVLVHGKKIKADWDGVTKNNLLLIRKRNNKKILIKEGIPFTPGFLFGFLILLYLFWRFEWWF